MLAAPIRPNNFFSTALKFSSANRAITRWEQKTDLYKPAASVILDLRRINGRRRLASNTQARADITLRRRLAQY
jgi:hypothetical protein